MSADQPTGDELLAMLSALDSPWRIRILAALAGRADYVSSLAREVGISRPLLHMHLKRLEDAGLVVGRLELSDDGKALKYFEVVPFVLTLRPETFVNAAETLTETGTDRSNKPKGTRS